MKRRGSKKLFEKLGGFIVGEFKAIGWFSGDILWGLGFEEQPG